MARPRGEEGRGGEWRGEWRGGGGAVTTRAIPPPPRGLLGETGAGPSLWQTSVRRAEGLAEPRGPLRVRFS